jgi:hypothetical protein
LPRLPVEQGCDLRSRGWHADGPENPAGRNTCVAQEQAAYNTLKVLWRQLDSDLQQKCIQIASGLPSYEALLGCVNQVRPIQDSRHRKAFTY